MSKIEELIEKLCPNGVEYIELNKVCRFQNGFAFKSSLFKDTGLPILRITNISEGKLSLDNYVYFDKSDYKENLNSGYNDNLSGMKCNLSLTSKLTNLPFNVIFAFWGAEEVGLKGSSYFIEKLDKNVKDNILLYINLDSIGAGDYLYYYHNDFNTSYGNAIDKVLSNEQINKLGSKRLYTNKTFNGINYCHIGLQSDNASFLSAGINSLNFFAGNLNAKGFGFFETNGINKLMHNTDNKQQIENIFGEKYNTNIQTVENLVVKVLNSSDVLNFKPEINTLVFKDWFLKLIGGALVVVLVFGTVIYFKIKKSR